MEGGHKRAPSVAPEGWAGEIYAQGKCLFRVFRPPRGKGRRGVELRGRGVLRVFTFAWARERERRQFKWAGTGSGTYHSHIANREREGPD